MMQLKKGVNSLIDITALKYLLLVVRVRVGSITYTFEFALTLLLSATYNNVCGVQEGPRLQGTVA